MSDVRPDRQCTLCDREAVNPERHGALCAECQPDSDGTPGNRETEGESGDENPGFDADKTHSSGSWQGAEFTNPDSAAFSPVMAEERRWMCRIADDKHSFSPWADSEHLEADPGKDARYKWGLKDNYADLETALEWDRKHPQTDGVTFQLVEAENEPYAFVDGDDVRDPETGEVHPAFIELLERLGITYADISTSGSGVHAMYLGDLPDGVKQAKIPLDDEPWKANDDPPVAELYDHKKVCVATGEHVPGTPMDLNRWDEDELEAILDEHGMLPDRDEDAGEKYAEFDSSDYEPDATESDETTHDVRDIFNALDRIDARRVAERTIVHRWNEDATTSDGKKAFVPSWGTNANGTANIVDRDIWQDTGGGGYGGPVTMALVDTGDLHPRNAQPPDGDLWWKGVDRLRELGFSIPEYVPSTDDAAADPEVLKRLRVTLDPEVAWRAAEAVTPDEIDGELGLETTDEGWLCAACEDAIDIVRAAAVDIGVIERCSAPLDEGDYQRAYQHARRQLDAPLPEYVGRETVTERWDVVRGAIEALNFNYLDEDALNSDITARADEVDGDAVLTLDPAWRDSESGESVMVFPSGAVYEAHPDHDGAIDALRFVALDAGVISWEEFTDDEYQLTGETFREAYDQARLYGAPLPRWEGTDAYQTAVLPPAEELVDEHVGDDERLEGAYDAVADLYDDLASTNDASVLQALPGLGKTGQVFRQADEHPPLYTAGRKELMAEAATRAEEHGHSAYHLPVFAEKAPPEGIVDTAERVLREHGQRLLRDRWELVERVRSQLPEGEELPDPDEYTPNEDDIQLDRESCDTADGEYGLEWWLAVHAARARGYTPQQIITNAPALFGEDLPCECDDDHEQCDYLEGWETATDPAEPFDVLVGHYTHAHVQSARTYAYREHNRVQEDPRVVAIDEYPGEAYQREFGDEFPDLAAWLASALREDIDDRQDLFTAAGDLWSDDAVREWLSRKSTGEEHAAIATALGAAQAALEAISTTEWLLEDCRAFCRDVGIERALERLSDAHPTYEEFVTGDAARTLEQAIADNPGANPTMLARIGDLAETVRELYASGGVETAIEDSTDEATHVAGPLESLVGDAIQAFRDREDSARDIIRAAQTALEGGPEGCAALAMHSDDGYAHPLAHTLLFGILAPDDSDLATTVRTSDFVFGDDEETRIKSVEYGTDTVLVDRNHNGAVVNNPPEFTAAGVENSVIGLDATGRETLWELALGREVTASDIHDTPRHRRQFLREVYGLQVIQTTPHAYSYEGDPSGKNLDDDVELVREISREYSDTVGQDPAVVTTKVVEDVIEERLEDVAEEFAHYGDLKGSNALSEHRLAALLGCQHYSDAVVERWAALAGEEANRTGRGTALEYGSPVANTVLKHMREDQVMQAALRFGRDSDGALVFCHTAALRDDLPVVAEGEVVQTFSEQQQAIGEAAKELATRGRFTVRDVAERVEEFDPHIRTVRRNLAALADAGYLGREETRDGVANEYRVQDEPRPAEIDLPDVEGRVTEPGQDPLEVVYTWSVRVHPGQPRPRAHRDVRGAQLPAPDGGDPPGEVSRRPG